MLAPWVRNAVAMFAIAVWGIYVLAEFVRNGTPEFYVWAFPVTILTGLPSIPSRKPAPPRPDPQEDST